MQFRKTLISAAATATLALGGLALVGGQLALPAMAQDDGPASEKRENADYFVMTFVDYKPGKRRGALETIRDHFIPATKAAGTPSPFALHFQSGRYDAAFYWKQEDGFSNLEWVTTPNGAKWWAALVKQEGGKEKAQKIWDDYLATVASDYTVIGHHHIKPEDGE